MSYTSALLIVRHPDEELDYAVFGDEPVIIELDLGDSFDITHPLKSDQPAVIEWVMGIRDEMLALELDEDDALLIAVECKLHEVMEAFELEDVDAAGEPVDSEECADPYGTVQP